MIFSEKSAFAQCGIFVSGVVSTVCSQESRFTLRDLQKIEVDIVLACIADTEEYSFLPGLISGVQ